jgi:hypothetical protein
MVVVGKLMLQRLLIQKEFNVPLLGEEFSQRAS